MKLFATYGLLVLLFGAVLIHPTLTDSANLTSVKDTLSSSRLAIHARVDSTGTSIGSSNVQILTSAGNDVNGAGNTANTLSTSPLKIGDSLTIGTGTYTVVGIVDASNFTVSPVIASGDQTNTNPIYLNTKPIHTITFTTASAVANGFFQVLLPADTSSSTNSNNGKADDEGYDFGNSTVTVTAGDVDSPGGGAVEYDFDSVTADGFVATAAGATGCTSTSYHCFEVHYSGTGAVGATISITIGSGANTPIAPASTVGHTEGTADTYPVLIKNFAAAANPNAATPVDRSTAKIALIEGVRVSATVDPTIDMSICGDTDCADTAVNPGDSVDGETLSSNTGGTSNHGAVALGVLSLSTPRLQAQEVAVGTNSAGGYVLTAIDDGALRKGSDDINDNVSPPTSPAVLNTPGTEAYGIHPSGADVNTTTWGTGSAAANKYSGTDATTPITLATNTGPTGSVKTFITYKANISATTAQGDYFHSVFYTATATF